MRIIINIALLVQFFLLQSFVYESMMKEIPVSTIFVTSFFSLYIISSIVYIKIFIRKVNETINIMLLVYGILVFALAYLSVDRLLILMPITKINSHSLYLTYIIAGLSGLTAIPVAYIHKYTLHSYSKSDVVLLFFLMMLVLIASLFIHIRTIIYIVSLLLILGSFTSKLKISDSDKHHLNQPIHLGGSFLIYFTSIFLSLLKPFLNYRVGLTSASAITILVFLFLFIFKFYPLFKRIYDKTISGIWVSILCLFGYHTSLQLNERFGEFVSFTSKRFYYVPTNSMMLLLFLIILLVFIFKDGYSKT